MFIWQTPREFIFLTDLLILLFCLGGFRFLMSFIKEFAEKLFFLLPKILRMSYG